MAKQTGQEPVTQPADSTPDATQEASTPPAQEQSPAQPTQPFVKQQPVVPTLQEVPFGPVNSQQPTHATPAEQQGDKGEQGKEGRFLTQAEIDAIVKERIAREREKYKDYDELKAKVAEKEEAEKTEAERQAQRLRDLESQSKTLAEQNRELRLKNSVMAAAAELGLPVDAAYRLADLGKATLDEQGNITNAQELVKAVADAYPGLVRTRGPAGSASNPGRGQQPVGRTDEDRRREYFGSGGDLFWSSGGVRMPEGAN